MRSTVDEDASECRRSADRLLLLETLIYRMRIDLAVHRYRCCRRLGSLNSKFVKLMISFSKYL